MSFASRKRALSECLDNETDETQRKKQKLDNNSSTNISSIWFLHHSDHEQFEQLFKSIDGSELIQLLNITHFINKEIAEYATGQFKKCGNDKCQNEIAILYQDKEIYDNNHENANKLGFKWCSISNKYYCSECMNYTESCDCECGVSHCLELKYTPNYNKCNLCNSPLFGCKCECGDCCWEWKCNNCNFKSCEDCYGLRECANCNQFVCDECNIDVDPYYNYDCLCNECYDESIYNKIIQCNNCNLKCQLFFKSNCYLYGVYYDGIMKKCGIKDCDIFVCFTCDAKERNGKHIICDESNCKHQVGVRCNQHIFDKTKCWKHKKNG